MADRLQVATRKGLFVLTREASGDWAITETAFLGQSVSLSLADPRDGVWYAAITHGHFGCHLHRSRNNSKIGGLG